LKFFCNPPLHRNCPKNGEDEKEQAGSNPVMAKINIEQAIKRMKIKTRAIRRLQNPVGQEKWFMAAGIDIP